MRNKHAIRELERRLLMIEGVVAACVPEALGILAVLDKDPVSTKVPAYKPKKKKKKALE